MVKICPVCGKEIKDAKHKNKIYCSQHCAIEAKRTSTEVKCDFCGKYFYEYQSKIKAFKRHFCSKECAYLGRRGVNQIFYEKDYAYMLLQKDDVTLKVLFDTTDVEKINTYKWHLHLRKKDNRYDVCANSFIENKKRRYIIMPRYLLNAPSELTVDHINRNTLDNRRFNLRIVSKYTNNQNKSNNTSGCVGVCWDKNRNKWHVTFRNKNIGRFENFEDAVKARKEAEKNYQLQNF